MIIDLFAGAGGWEESLRGLGLADDCLGIELDTVACATAQAAGHRRLHADVATLDPLEYQPIDGLIASPPCQSYSNGGKRLGRQDIPEIVACAHELATGVDTRVAHRPLCADARSLLIVEPLRWALALRPRWIACEQVPAALELWTLFASLLGQHGYQSAAGVLSAERYGVPQTRQRAYLIASRDGQPQLPDPTHEAYRKGWPPGLALDLLPWVSMAEALDWADDDLVGFPRRADQANDILRLDGIDYRVRGFRAATEPAFALTAKARSWTHLRQNARSGATWRRLDEPAPTITAGHDSGDRRWVASGEAAEAGEAHVAVSVREASVLMGFPAGYPWQGARTRQFLQIGNAVCPPVGQRVIEAAMAPTSTCAREAA